MLYQFRPDKAQQQASEELTMVKRDERKRGQQGFTLIEIIAVLVILGILAVVAIPKYLDMQKQAAVNAVQGAIAALSSQVAMDYANDVLASPSVASAWRNGSAAVTLTVGDFAGNYSINNGSATVTVTSGANAQGNNVYNLASGATNFDTLKSRSFLLYPTQTQAQTPANP